MTTLLLAATLLGQAATAPRELTPADFGWTRITDPKHKAWKHRFVPDVKTKALFLLDVEKFKSRIPKVIADDKSPDGTIKERVLLPLPDGTFDWYTVKRAARVEEEAHGAIHVTVSPGQGTLSISRFGIFGTTRGNEREVRILALAGEKTPTCIVFSLHEFRARGIGHDH